MPSKLCQICDGTESDQTRKRRRMEEARKIQERLAMEKKQKQEARRKQEELLNGRQKKIVLLSEKCKRMNLNSDPDKKKVKKKPKPKALTTLDVPIKTEDTEVKQKVQVMSMIADELSDPSRDCKKFDPSKRARELFNALDDDGNGSLTEDEFVTGCMSDEAFVKVLDEFSGDFIWGYTNGEPSLKF